MVLNPAVIDEPDSPRLHMLSRASGPWPQARQAGKPAPYPIFLGYACSEDGGRHWQADWSRPAFGAEPCKHRWEKITIRDRDSHEVVNHANGCSRRPAELLRPSGAKLPCTTACRMFPPRDRIGSRMTRCSARRKSAQRRETILGRAASENVTVSVLWEVDLTALAAGHYEEAFVYVTHLTDPEPGDNRDVMLSPEAVVQNGRPAYLCLPPSRSGRQIRLPLRRTSFLQFLSRPRDA